MSHDQNFKNLLLDYPLDALRLFAPEEAQKLQGNFKITPLRQEQLKQRLGDRFRELDCPLQVEWLHGEREALLFVVEEETEPRHFSIHRLAHYCLDLSELCATNRVVPVVIFLHPGDCAQQLCLGSGGEPYLGFRYVACHLPRLAYADYQHSDNIVACLNLLNMQYAITDKVAVYAQSLRNLLRLEQRPDKQEKYIDFIDQYGSLTVQEQQQYQRDYPEEEQQMSGRIAQARQEGWQEGQQEGRQEGRQEGWQEGRQEGMQRGAAKLLLAQLKLKFGQELDETVQQQIAQADTETLQRWSERILTAHKLQQVLR
jgi:hypothetical protein